MEYSYFKDTEKDSDQIVIRVGKACNFQCLFCNVSDNEKINKNEDIKSILLSFIKQLNLSHYKENILVTISGGEPSLFKKEVILILKGIKKICESRNIGVNFDIQTNASMVTRDFAFEIKKLGITDALVSFHTHDTDIFSKLISLNTSLLNKSIEGVDYLLEAGIDVSFNIIFNKLNYKNVFETVLFLRKRFPSATSYEIGFVQPHGDGSKNIKELFISYEEIKYNYNKVLFYLKNEGVRIMSHFCGLPPCFLLKPNLSGEIRKNLNTYKNKGNNGEKTILMEINDENKAKQDPCSDCVFNDVCGGIWKYYNKMQNVINIPYRGKYDIVLSGNTSQKFLKKIYDGNTKKIAFEYKSGNEELLLDNINSSLNIGFYKVGVIINSRLFPNQNILDSGIGNIVFFMDLLSDDDFGKLIEGIKNNSYSVDIDIVINIYNKEFEKRVLKLIDIINGNNVKVFLELDGSREMSKYATFFNEINNKNIQKNLVTKGFYPNFKRGKNII